MSTTAVLTTWQEFLQLPDEEELEKGNHFELHDGEIVLVAPPRAVHTYKQGWLAKWLTLLEDRDTPWRNFPTGQRPISNSGALTSPTSRRKTARLFAATTTRPIRQRSSLRCFRLPRGAFAFQPSRQD
jgi:hypothetical protein